MAEEKQNTKAASKFEKKEKGKAIMKSDVQKDVFHTLNSMIKPIGSPLVFNKKLFEKVLKDIRESYSPAKLSKKASELSSIVSAQPLQIEFPADQMKGNTALLGFDADAKKKKTHGGKRKRGAVEQNDQDETEVVIDDERRNVKVSAFLSSPFAERVVSLVSKRTADEERAARFIFSASQPPK